MTYKKIMIVGGGSAGWITAALMNGIMNKNGQKKVDISLIESPDIPRIAVGEATVPNIRQILITLGIDELDFMKSTDATFKQGIKFNNWLHNTGDSYYHQFSRYTPNMVDTFGQEWLKSDRSIPFADTISVQPALCEMNLSPKLIGLRQHQIPVSYAYHLNALKMADYLRDIAVGQGVTHYLDNITKVDMTEQGDIAAVNTEKGSRYEADLFVDCTGFASLLIEKELGIGWEDFSDYLFCDRACVMQVPYETYYPGRVNSVTQATALSAGWIWDIPLTNRRGIGHVYSSAFITDDDAEKELRTYEGAHSDHLSTRVVHFQVGRRKKTWAANCVAIGLSGGFLEPLESTGLYLVQTAALLLAEHFPFDGQMKELSDKFNILMSDRFDEILSFINLHYCLTQRTDTDFWQEVQRPEHILRALQEKLDYWKIKPPSQSDFKDQYTLFTHQNHELVLYGMDFLKDHYRQKYGPELSSPIVPGFIQQRLQAMQSQLPLHDEWLHHSLGMPRYPSAYASGV
ncbi:tryptophan halogenase family protein [Paremcibacter congregatus]|uniref:Tryptophan halogenase n=1 Tax=Paremcibacter congregatus TaxID=2043170 RepID=A0A2G4YW34_9PROT|nr:tryptophan halogenase family protein [Paremcibacter congregatus]PHZ86554.1 tryptophan halogenase [Paremcibacter congregatus]QDE26359.1 tryptophan 7-halogenase [Paremcibacter congregatus]